MSGATPIVPRSARDEKIHALFLRRPELAQLTVRELQDALQLSFHHARTYHRQMRSYKNPNRELVQRHLVRPATGKFIARYPIMAEALVRARVVARVVARAAETHEAIRRTALQRYREDILRYIDAWAGRRSCAECLNDLKTWALGMRYDCDFGVKDESVDWPESFITEFEK